MIRPIALTLTLLAATPALAQTPPAAPPAAEKAAPAAAPEEVIIAPSPASSIPEALKSAGRFNTLLKALDGSGLTPLLQRPGAFTLFAPTDQAFSAMDPATLADLMKPENAAKLQRVIAYHLVNTKILADQVAGHASAPVPSVLGTPITLDGAATPIKVNDASVLQAGVLTSNGVIYVVDRVLSAPQ